MKLPGLRLKILTACGVVAAGFALSAGPALAQFPQIFAPPRPPANVPSRPPPPAPNSPLGLPEQMPPEEMDDDTIQPVTPGRPQQGAARPQAPGQPGNVPGAVRSQPLAPPPGSAAAPPGAPPIQPGQAPRGQIPAAPRGPGGGQQTDEVITEMPSQKIANPTAIFAGLDKITGRIISFEVALNEKVQFGALQVVPRVCYTRPPTESANTDSFVEVDEVTLQGEVKRLFTGWMFASSPGLHAVEHPIYDVWLTDCKGGITVTSDAQPAPAPAAASARPATPRPGTQAPRPPQQQAVPPVPPPGFAAPRR